MEKYGWPTWSDPPGKDLTHPLRQYIVYAESAEPIGWGPVIFEETPDSKNWLQAA